MNQSDHIVHIEHPDGSKTEVLVWDEEWLPTDGRKSSLDRLFEDAVSQRVQKLIEPQNN